MLITKKQICLLFITIIPASKFLILPTVYASLAHQDTWLAGLLNCLLDGALLTAMLFILKKFEGQTLYEVLEYTFGRAVAKTVYFIYFLYFMLKATVPVFEQKLFTEITLYETAPSVLTFLPFFFVSFYLCLKGIRVMARTGEIVFWFTALGLLLVIFLSIGTTDPYYLMPVLKNPVKQTLTATYSGLIWYGQPIILLFLMGGIKREKRFNLSLIISFTVAALLCVVIYAIFIGIYGDIAVRQIYALTKMTKYAIALSNVGRFDYIASILLAVSSVLALAAPLVLAMECIKHVFGGKRKWLLALIINGVMLIVTVALQLYFQTVLDLFSRYFTPVMFILVYLLPPLVLLIKRKEINA